LGGGLVGDLNCGGFGHGCAWFGVGMDVRISVILGLGLRNCCLCLDVPGAMGIESGEHCRI